MNINEAVARKLGFRDLEYRPNIGFMDLVGHRKGSPPFGETVPDYSHSLKAAWEIVEHLKGNFFLVRGFPMNDPLADEWTCQFGTDHSPMMIRGQAETAPMAICLAFLKLGGSDESLHKSAVEVDRGVL